MGLIGGSFALALKKAGTYHIVGVGRSLESLQEAKSLGVIDAYVDTFSDALQPQGLSSQNIPAKAGFSCVKPNIHEALEGADLVLIAAPVAQTASILQSIRPHLSKNTIITDAGSTKTDVLACAKEILGEQFNQFVGGHPIAGAEKSGVTAATANLYVGKNVVLTPALEANRDAVARVADFWRTCGATISEISAETHDSIFAAVSHLPHLLAFALVDDIASRPNAQQLFSFAASGFRDFTRIAGSHPEMWRDISLANKTALLTELDAYLNELSQLKKLLTNEDGAGLQALFERASAARNAWAKK